MIARTRYSRLISGAAEVPSKYILLRIPLSMKSFLILHVTHTRGLERSFFSRDSFLDNAYVLHL